MEDSAVSIEEGDEAVGRGVRLLEPFGVDPADGFAATVFKENCVIKGRDRTFARAWNPRNPCAEGVEDGNVVEGLGGNS